MRKNIWKVFFLLFSLLSIACQGDRGKTQVKTLDIPFSSSTETQLSEEAESLGSSSADEKAADQLEIPVGKAGVPSLLLHREGYTASYNMDTKTPNWVAWYLTDSHTGGKVKRSGITFHADEDVPEPRVDTYDYMRSGFDRGHMCPAGDNRWSQLAMEQSFLMTNVCPQNPALNSGLWNTIEVQCREWAKRYGDVYIVCGPIYFNQKHKTIGMNKVQVPEAFFKVVLCMDGEPKAIGFICRNVSAKGHKKIDYVNSVDEVERITGINFFPKLPDDIEQRVERYADYSEWK